MVSLEKGREARRQWPEELTEARVCNKAGLGFSFLFLGTFCCLGLVNPSLRTGVIRRTRLSSLLR